MSPSFDLEAQRVSTPRLSTALPLSHPRLFGTMY